MIISMRRIFYMVIAFWALAACGSRSGQLGLTPAEKALINGSDSLMRVLTIYDSEDSLLLRDISVDFTDKDLRSEEFKALAAKMLYTVQDPSQDGVGIAGPQVGLNRRVVAVQRYDLPGDREGGPDCDLCG